MGIVPENTSPRIAWYGAHLGPWGEHAEQIGVSAEQVAELEAKVAAARQMFVQQKRAQAAARSATLGLEIAMRELSQLGAVMIAQIRARAQGEGSSVNTLAQIPRIADRSPIPAPGKPTNLEIELGSQGEIELKWKCKNPRGSEGTMYEIRRKIGDGPFVVLGVAGTKHFVDETIPAGTASAEYSIRAFRSTRRGVVALFNVYFGVGKGYIPRPQFERTAVDPHAQRLTVHAA